MAALLGLVIMGVGGLLAVAAIARPIAVGDTVNLGLMCDRLSLLIGAGSLMIVGALFLAASAVVGSVNNLRETIRVFERRKYQDRHEED